MMSTTALSTTTKNAPNMVITSTGGMDANDATERVLERLGKAKTNLDFLANLSKEMAR